MSRDPDSVALDAANNIVHAIDEMAFPGGDVQLKAHIQCIVYDAIHRANTLDSAAQGAMGVIEKDDLRNILDDLHAGCISANAILTLEDWLRADCLVRPSDTTAQWKPANDAVLLCVACSEAIAAQPIDLTDERAAFENEFPGARNIRYVANSYSDQKYNIGWVAWQARALLDNTAQGKPRNFCADCGKRTPEGSIHTCAPAYAVEQEDHIVDAAKMMQPAFTTGHCEHHKQPGGCQQHNLHCGWPKCDQKEINHA